MKKRFHKEIFDRIPEERRKNLLETAIHEFAHHGFDNANINTIAEKAGISVGSIYKYFDTKKDLFNCVHHGVVKPWSRCSTKSWFPGSLLVKLEKLSG